MSILNKKLLQEVATRAQSKNSHILTNEEKVWAKLCGVTEERFRMEKLVARYCEGQTPDADKSGKLE